MNSQSNSGKSPNPQAPLRPIPRTGLRGSAGIILHVLLFFAAASVGIGICAMRTTSQLERNIAEGFAVASLLLLFLHLWRSARRAKGVLPILILTAGFLFYLTDYSFIPPAVLIGLIFAVGEGSVLLAVQPRRRLMWFLLVPIAAYGATVLISFDPLGAVAALIPFPAMLVLALATRHSAGREDGLTRVGVICATSLTLGLSLGAMLALTLFRRLGSLSVEALSGAMESFRAAAIEAITQMEVPGELKELVSLENATNMVNSFINLLPGYAVMMVNLIAAVCQFIQHAGLVAFGFGESITDRVRVFRMSTVSCLVFLLAYVVLLISGTEKSTLAGTVSQNIYTVLMPGMAFAGLLRLAAGISRRGMRGMGCMFFLVLFIPLLFIMAPLVLAVVELGGRFSTWLAGKFKPPEDDDPFGKPPFDNR